MNRRDFIKNTVAAAEYMTLGGIACTNNNPPKSKKPNILYIMTDQQSARMLSCAGNKWLKTPALDQLAASGIRFNRAYACNPVCVPSRFSLQTGLMPSAIGMGRNEDSPNAHVTDEIIRQSLGNLLNNTGYNVTYGGKVHLPEGMKELSDLGYQNLTSDPRQTLADTCAAFIKQKHDKPFFLFASFINPHDICYMAINDFLRTQGKNPYQNTDSKTCEMILDQARQSKDLNAFVNDNCPELDSNHEIPENEPECITRNYTEARPFRAFIRKNWSELQWRLHRWAYCRLTEMVDEKIGILLNALKQAGLEKDTLVIFTSDHGDMDSAHKMEHKSVL